MGTRARRSCYELNGLFFGCNYDRFLQLGLLSSEDLRGGAVMFSQLLGRLHDPLIVGYEGAVLDQAGSASKRREAAEVRPEVGVRLHFLEVV